MTNDDVQSIRVLHRTGQWCDGLRVGDVAMYEVGILPQWQVAGRPTTDRSYLLLAEGVQLTQPVVFTGALAHRRDGATRYSIWMSSPVRSSSVVWTSPPR